MPSPVSGGKSFFLSPSTARSKSKPREVTVTNFDKLFEDDKLRQRHRSCSRSEKIFDRTDKNIFTPTSSSFPSPFPVSSCQTPCGSSYRVVERSCPKTFLEKLTRRPEKSSRQIAEEVRSEVLQICCDPCRPLPGYLDIVTQGQRLELGIDCDEVLPRMIIASGKTVKNVNYMKHLGVTHIINTASRDVWLPVEKLSNLGVKLIQFHVDDIPTANISAYFTASANFLAQAMESGGLIAVNCLVGFSRSASILTAALMMNNHWSLMKTLKKLRQSRSVKPNIGFMVQLLNLENQLKMKGVKLI